VSTTVADVRADLIAEQDALDAALVDLPSADWATPTESPRWSVADQVSHLAFFDDTASLAIEDPDGFTEHKGDFVEHLGDELAIDEMTLGAYRQMEPAEMFATWRANRVRLAEASARLADDDRVIWYGPSMGAKSFLTARLMETWAHGQDAVNAVGRSLEPSDRLAHIARLGFITRGWSYVNRKLDPSEVPVSVRLTAPSGVEWVFGDEGAEQSVRGPAEDFCLVVTQRRHVDNTELAVVGEAAREWMLIAQAFAGAPTSGPAAS